MMTMIKMIMNMMMKLIMIGVDDDDEGDDRMMIIMMIMMIKTMMSKMIMIEKIADEEIILEDFCFANKRKNTKLCVGLEKSYQTANSRFSQKSIFVPISLTRFPIHS